MSRLKMPPTRRTEFRAVARKLVEVGTHRRKSNIPDDFAGRIANALSDAYLRGVQEAELVRSGSLYEKVETEPFDVSLLSKLSRESFIFMADRIFGGPYAGPLTSTPKGFLYWSPPNPPDSPEERWQLARWLEDGEHAQLEDRLLSRKLVSPWKAHGLVEVIQQPHRHLQFTRQAFEAWCAFLKSNPTWGRWHGGLDTSGYKPDT